MEPTGRIFSISRFATDDGDGIRTCVFFKGCPLSCAWCHNAESVDAGKEISYVEKNCVACGACAAVCPRGCHAVSARSHSFSREKCDACGECAKVCPSLALTLLGEDVSVEELLRRVEKDRDFYARGGGVTLSGGEPTAQGEFAAAFAKAAREAGINVAVETCGFCRGEVLATLAAHVDTFLYDCKAAAEDHKRLTGVEDGVIVENLLMLHEMKKAVVLRCPVVEGGNLTDAFVDKIGRLSQYADSVTLLPYHKSGVGKSALLGKAPQESFGTPSRETLERVAKTVESYHGKSVKF